MKTSARNTLKGTIETITHGAVNAEVALKLFSGTRIHAVITRESVRFLGLVPGKVAYALIKSSWAILVAADERIVTSARNQLCGVVRRVERGAINTEVELDLGQDGAFVVMITNASQDLLKCAVGTQACAAIKASHVVIAVEE